MSLTGIVAMALGLVAVPHAQEPAGGAPQARPSAGDAEDDGRGRGHDRGAHKLRVASYNIHHGAGNDVCTPPPVTTPPGTECAMNLERVADVVRALDADVVGFQEIDRFWARSGYVDQAMRLGELLHMNVCFGGNLDHQADNHADRPHQYGTLILSKRPLRACWNTLLPRVSTTTEQRGLLHAIVDVHGTPVHIYDTHLHTTIAERTVQVPAVDALVAANTPAILLGDFNAQPTETTLAPLQARFQDAWVAAGSGDGFTYPAEPDAAPNRRIDFAFATPDITIKTIAVDITTDSSMAADHYPLSVSVEVPKRKATGRAEAGPDHLR